MLLAGPEIGVHRPPGNGEGVEFRANLSRRISYGACKKQIGEFFRTNEQHPEKKDAANYDPAEPKEESPIGNSSPTSELIKSCEWHRTAHFDPGESKDAPEQERKHVAGFLKDHQRERKGAI